MYWEQQSTGCKNIPVNKGPYNVPKVGYTCGRYVQRQATSWKVTGLRPDAGQLIFFQST
jgi:hypothetical protein